jgi:hypothetical protein
MVLLDGLLELEDSADLQQQVQLKWRQWLKIPEWNVADQLVARKVPLSAEIGTLISILKGNIDVISAHAKTWSQCVVAQMMFGRSDHKLGVVDLPGLVEDVLVQWGNEEDSSDDYEGVIKALMRLEMQPAIQCFSQRLGDWWSAAHLADIVYRGSWLASQQFAADFRAYSMRNYLDVLLSSNRLWQVLY